jgi:hypothetical protein
MHIDVHLEDSDDRAVAYVAGTSPNRWGVLPNGKTVRQMYLREAGSSSDTITNGSSSSSSSNTIEPARRQHPLFPAVALALLKEVSHSLSLNHCFAP